MNKKQALDILEDLASGDLTQAKRIEELIRAKEGVTFFPVNTKEILSKFITQDPDMIKLKQTVMSLAHHSITDTVLIRGPSGTGKEIIANALHGDRTGPFCAINCTALPSELVESELFGHAKGSFTGAIDDRKGKFEYARDGTLFLDEIGDMPQNTQAKLLRVLETNKITRLGENLDREVKVRVICATNQDLHKFRDDLYHRISTFELFTSPLLDRPNDIPLITKYLCPNYPEEEIRRLQEFPLHGNVRDIKKIIRRWEILGETLSITTN
jgi:transcriptional regulator with GAF, ATPase, and Fis domain